MKKKDKTDNKKQKAITKSIEKLKAFGSDASDGEQNTSFDADQIRGGKNDTTVDTHWPTTSGGDK